MQKTVVKYSIIFLLLTVFINRGLFVTPSEAENQGDRELNSVIEWVLQLITGESNDIDEDGDIQTDCSISHTFLYDFPQQLVLINIIAKDIKTIRFPHKDIIPYKIYHCQIDHPPEMN